MSYSGNVHEITFEEKQILLIGTAHISQSSVDEVNSIINQEKPDTVCIELCSSRHQTMLDKNHWKKMDIFKVVREGKSFLLFAFVKISFAYVGVLILRHHKKKRIVFDLAMAAVFIYLGVTAWHVMGLLMVL